MNYALIGSLANIMCAENVTYMYIYMYSSFNTHVLYVYFKISFTGNNTF